MGDNKISSAVASDLTNAVSDYSVDTKSTDGVFSQKETTWMNADWSKYFGYYWDIPELNTTIDARATWTVGKGIQADEQTTLLLDTLKGWGKDTFNTILENMIRTMLIGGDSYAEIIRDDEDNLINLKTLDPEVMKHVVGQNGVLLRYEQTSKTKEPVKKFRPDEIFHLSRNRVADQIHGTSVITKLMNIILMRNEAMTDYKQVMHRYMKPRYIFHLDTDDEVKIAKFKATMDKAWADGENMYVPKDAVVPEVMAIAPNATLDPKQWIENLSEYFYEGVGVPRFIVGGAGGLTEAAVKISYLAFQQTIEEDQLFIEEQVLAQLNLVIELEFPVSLENELLSDEKKDGPENIDANDTTAGSGQ